MTEPPRSRWRDFWQLHVPLVLVLTLCLVLTVVEVRRASEGVWRAWFYMIEWPLIGAVSVWIWHRYRTEGNVASGLVNRWKERVASLTPASDAVDTPATKDEQLDAWQTYVDDLERRQPPGGPPQ